VAFFFAEITARNDFWKIGGEGKSNRNNRISQTPAPMFRDICSGAGI
jgi:hypothetical protein